MGALSVVILYDKTLGAGKRRDAEVLEVFGRQVNNILKNKIGSVRIVDPREHPVHCDVQVHLEFPVLANLAWSRVNMLVVNPAKYTRDYYAAIHHHFDFIIFRSKATMTRFCESGAVPLEKAWYLPVETKWSRGKKGVVPKKELVMFVGGSVAKEDAARHIIAKWREEYPHLTVYAMRNFMNTSQEKKEQKSKKASVRNVLDIADELGDIYENIEGPPSWVTMRIGNYTDEERQDIIMRTRGVIVAATTDDAGHTMIEALELGAIVIANDIEAYADIAERLRYKDSIIRMAIPKISVGMDIVSDFTAITRADIDRVVGEFSEMYEKPLRLINANTAGESPENYYAKVWKRVSDLIDERPIRKYVPPVLQIDDCPDISVVTLIYNRRKFFNVASHNMLLTDYPKGKIEWIIVDDSDDVADSASDLIVKFQNQHPEFRNISYVPLTEKKSIGVKRNLGVQLATTDIVLMMDDDDHYPQTSFRRRVAWLQSTWPNGAKPACVGCSSIAMYDLVRGVSAVNVPPYNLLPASRISEATLTFYKKFWETNKFPDVSMSEGEKWLAGREAELMEIAPQQIIVAFNHGKNASTRQIPDRADKGCFWGFPREYLEFIHDAAGLQVEWTDKKKN